jgi:hypothetical protein
MQSTTGKNTTYILILIMSFVLLIFTASRTLDLLQTFLPPGQEAFAYLGIVAFDGGLVGWSFFYAHGARGKQRSMALIMVIVSLAAVGVSTLADMYLGAADNGLLSALSQGTRLAVLLVIGGVIVANIVAFFLVHISEPEREKAIASEEAKAEIYSETMKQIKAAAPQVAAQIAPELARQWVRETTASMLPGKRVSIVSTDMDAPWYSDANLPAIKPEQLNGHKARGSLQPPKGK